VIDGTALEQLKAGDINGWRGDHVGLVFQTHHLLPVLTASQNVELPLLRMPLNSRDRASRAHDALELVGLAARANHLPRDLSGGERQRVALARAIVTNANLILCDEPTGSLNREARDVVLAILRSLATDYGRTIVLVTHDPEAAAIAGLQLTLTGGRTRPAANVVRAALTV
jgi:putative ABC transport system ATP-binding protein